MSIKTINKETGDIGELVAGGTLFADSPLLTVVSSYDTVAAPGWKLLTTDVAGRTLSRTEYKELFDLVTERGLIGEGKPFGEGDGSTTFVLPDAREVTFKGIGLTSHTVGAHLDEDGLTVGEFLDDRLQDYFSGGDLPTYIGGESGIVNLSDGDYAYYVGNQRRTLTATRRGATTEVKSIGINYFMKVKQVPVPADFVSAMDKIYGVLIPDNASESNKLVTKSDVVIKHDYSMAGTASLEDDIKTFVTALIALGANTYTGFFNRSGTLGTAGNYSITVYAEEGTSTFASGYIVFGAGATGKAQYLVSYYKPIGSSEEWTIKKLVTESDTVKRKNVSIAATTSIENDIKTLLDELIVETSGSYTGSFTRTGNTSGYYSVSVISTWNVVGVVSICGAATNAYRVAKFKNTEEGAYTYQIEKLFTENEAILHHDISIPVESGVTPNTPFDALQYQLIHTDWTFLTSSDWNSASGGYELQGYYWGSYTATHTASNQVIVTGTITWAAKPHTFSAYHDPSGPVWKITIDGEELVYNNNNIIVVRDVLTEKRLFIRNTGETNVGALYSALDALGLLNKPAIGGFNWTIQQQRTFDVGSPYNATHWTDTLTVGQLSYFQNPRLSTLVGATSEWWLYWSDGNVYCACNMWGESDPICTYISLEYVI